MRLTVKELLDHADSLRTKKDRVQVIKDYMSQYPELKEILMINFNHDNKGFNGLPAGEPEEYKPDLFEPLGYSSFTLANSWRKLYMYADKGLDDSRKLVLYIQLIEGLHHTEAKILNAAKDGSLHYTYPWMKDDFYDYLFLGKVDAPKKTKVDTNLEVAKEFIKTGDPEVLDKLS